MKITLTSLIIVSYMNNISSLNLILVIFNIIGLKYIIDWGVRNENITCRR